MDYDAICGICAALAIRIWSVTEYVEKEKANRENRRHVFY